MIAPEAKAETATSTVAREPMRPIDTSRLIPNRLLRGVYQLVQPAVERALGFPEMWRHYEACSSRGVKGAAFAHQFLESVGFQWAMAESEWAELRTIEGPVVVTANHPHGGLDAFVLMQVLHAIRPDSWQMLANEVLGSVPELQGKLIAVNPLATSPEALRRNATGMVRALKFLRGSGSALGIFSAGRVSHRHAELNGAVCDRPWKDHAVRLAQRSGATLVCLNFSGQNSGRFLAVPPTWSRVRALMLGRELAYPPSEKMAVRLAAVLSPGEVARLAESPAAGNRLRARCYLRVDRELKTMAPAPEAARVPVCGPVDVVELEQEVDGLGESAKLFRSSDGEIDVLYFQGHRGPALVRELGRGRELTFREAGQGSGLACDVSSEDDYYHHLVLWHRLLKQVIGAYRLGITREILARHGPRGLYLDHVFAIAPEFYDAIGPSIELSRSFIRPEFQRDSRALALLWRGLGAVAVREACPTFFGSVTISSRHHPATRAILVEHLRRNHADSAALCQRVQARRPFEPTTTFHRLVGEAYAGAPLEALAPLVESLESEGRTIPPLMRYYCSLGAKFLAYHIEPTFQDALYCFLRVDLRAIPPGYRRRFLGETPPGQDSLFAVPTARAASSLQPAPHSVA
jgi:putative hemolysin